MPLGERIYNSPHRHVVNQMLAAGYSCEVIARVLWEKYRFKVTGMTVANYKKEYFDPLKEKFEDEIRTMRLLKQAAELDLSQKDKIQNLINQLEELADFLEPLNDTSSIKLRSDILFRAGTLRLKLMQLTSEAELKKREEELLNVVAKIIADYIFPYIPEDKIEEVRNIFESRLEAYLEAGVLE
jgi:hypothetical protein